MILSSLQQTTHTTTNLTQSNIKKETNQRSNRCIAREKNSSCPFRPALHLFSASILILSLRLNIHLLKYKAVIFETTLLFFFSVETTLLYQYHMCEPVRVFQICIDLSLKDKKCLKKISIHPIIGQNPISWMLSRIEFLSS